jgi:DNA primase
MSFWNADHARQNFVVMDMLNGVAQWENDKDALQIRAKVVDPMLTHVREMLVDFNLRITNDLTKKDKAQMDEDLIEGILISQLTHVSKYQDRCMNMINRIDDKYFSNSIVKLLASEFQIKYDTIEREIEKKEQKNKTRRKAYNKRTIKKKKTNSEVNSDMNVKVKKQMEEIAKKERDALQKKIEDDLDEEVRQKDLARKKQLADRRKNEKVIRTYESDDE